MSYIGEMDHPGFCLMLKQTFTREELNYAHVLEKRSLVNLWTNNIKSQVLKTAKTGDTYESIYVEESSTNKDELGNDILPDLLKKLKQIFPDSVIEFREDINRIIIDWSLPPEKN